LAPLFDYEWRWSLGTKTDQKPAGLRLSFLTIKLYYYYYYIYIHFISKLLLNKMKTMTSITNQLLTSTKTFRSTCCTPVRAVAPFAFAAPTIWNDLPCPSYVSLHLFSHFELPLKPYYTVHTIRMCIDTIKIYYNCSKHCLIYALVKLYQKQRRNRNQ